MRKCVAFVALKLADGSRRFVGSAFTVSRRITGTDQMFAFMVTARHIVEEARARGLTEVSLRINWPDGSSRWMDVPLTEWLFHPTAPEVDVAVYCAGPDPASDHMVYPIERIIPPEAFPSEGFGLGDEVVIIGLFANHSGDARNVPIVRVGNLAALPEERLSTQLGLAQVMLIEARSIGGLSGSPVFANLGSLRVVGGRVRASTGPVIRLIGLIHGHFDDVPDRRDSAPPLDGADSRINMGIAVVTPGSKLLEVLNQPRITQEVTKIEEAIRAGRPPDPRVGTS